MKRVKYLMMLLVMTLAVSSCGFESNDFLGTWESFAYFDGYEEIGLYDYERLTYSVSSGGSG